MAYKMISNCDECGKEGEYNPNYLRPNNWIGCSFKSNGRSKEAMDFCSKECLKKFIDSLALGHAVGHQINEFAVSEKEE